MFRIPGFRVWEFKGSFVRACVCYAVSVYVGASEVEGFWGFGVCGSLIQLGFRVR